MTPHLVYLLVTVTTFLVLRYFLRRQTKRLPPGPNGRFLVGNLPDLPKGDAKMAETYVKWRNDYGSIMHLEIFGKHMIVLNSAQAAHDLMDKRAAIYSHRPRMPMLIELVGNSWVVSVISGEPHRERRSIAQRYFLAQFKDWQRVQLESSRTLLRNLFDDPDNWAAFLRLAVASSFLQICYGHKVTDANDVLLKIVQDALEVPRNYPYFVDVFPIRFPHMVIEEDEYLGYRIPKGSTVVGNAWAILRDPVVFSNPEKFDPWRFLPTREGSETAREVIDSTVYGWGKRACPGRHVGYSALFIMISNILTCFNIEKPLDDAGNEVIPSLKYISKSFVRRAQPTPCTIRPRSDKIARLFVHPE
ncbi:cytochrome P450 [Pisolithus sp. B1]|nr:cytochrome P450 [Pisolithus sp. B1]